VEARLHNLRLAEFLVEISVEGRSPEFGGFNRVKLRVRKVGWPPLLVY
jgi:hypothetical protein